MAGSGAVVYTNPAVQASILVGTMSSNAQSIYTYYSNVTSNVNCLLPASNLSFLLDQNSSTTLSSGSCPSGKTAAGPIKNGVIVCNKDGIVTSNAIVHEAYTTWLDCKNLPHS
jgi:hypothetical protein